MRLNVSDGMAEAVLKRAFFLAYEACGRPSGMGVLQELRLGGKKADEERVWQAVVGQEDYDGFRAVKSASIVGQEVYGDYVLGRMIKWGGRVESADVLAVPDLEEKLTPDYHSFAGKYPTTRQLIEAATASLSVNYKVVTEE